MCGLWAHTGTPGVQKPVWQVQRTPDQCSRKKPNNRVCSCNFNLAVAAQAVNVRAAVASMLQAPVYIALGYCELKQL